ncbi:MAG: YraN family protein [Pseudomonadota bacterium]
MNKRAEGEQHEAQAAQYLQSQGLTLLQSNYHSRFGEIDLIMRDAGALVFVEVRYRKSDRFGGPRSSITEPKQRKIALTALHYLQTKKLTDTNCRFDAVSVTPHGLDWIKDAFYSPLR